ncbi:hypothetical protein C2G38_2073279 [Gigaspora rosea]|uniref:Uncharacterized protein n=1 Tax=Gigaspora rosea TaxID=44941 RepID=A0A397VPR2_9GLOM|nr:hypothetical protein C2G38_2073279 [Gigaspora rosea]
MGTKRKFNNETPESVAEHILKQQKHENKRLKPENNKSETKVLELHKTLSFELISWPNVLQREPISGPPRRYTTSDIPNSSQNNTLAPRRPPRSKTLPSNTKVEQRNKFLSQLVDEPKEDASILQSGINTTLCTNCDANLIVLDAIPIQSSLPNIFNL